MVQGEFFHEAFEIFFGDGIFNVDGEMWKKQRKVASYEFSSAKLREFSSVVFRDFSVKMACILSNAASTQQTLDMQVNPWTDLLVSCNGPTSFLLHLGIT